MLRESELGLERNHWFQPFDLPVSSGSRSFQSKHTKRVQALHQLSLHPCSNSTQRRHGKESQMSTLRPIFAWTCIVFLTYALAGCATYERCGLEGCPGDVMDHQVA